MHSPLIQLFPLIKPFECEAVCNVIIAQQDSAWAKIFTECYELALIHKGTLQQPVQDYDWLHIHIET